MSADKKLPCQAWVAVTKAGKVWPQPWVYIRRTKPKEIEYSGFRAVRVKIIPMRQNPSRKERV